MSLRKLSSIAAIVLLMLVAMPSADALIMGSDGDEPVENDGWPSGAAEIFNIRERVAYWEGPPFGGGQYHGEYRGDTEVLNQVLDKFADVDNDNKRIVVEDGIGNSFWLNPNRDQEKENRARIDWQLMIWNAENWTRLSDMPAGINPIDPQEKKQGPPTVLTIFAGGNIDWEKVQLPEGVEVVDNRLEAHGLSPEDGLVVQGVLRDVETDQPMSGRVYLQDIDPQTPAEKKGYTAAEATVSDDGEWTIKQVPVGWFRLIATSEGYLPRIVGYVKPDGQPRLQQFTSALSKAGELAGTVTDAEGHPLEDVCVRLSNTSPAGGGRYDSPQGYQTMTDAEGNFQITAPVGTASIRLFKPGWCRPGLGPETDVPADDIELEMVRSSNITVIILFESADVPDKYMVELEPEGGSRVGMWSGSANIDENNQYIFKNVPPGRYTLVGHPNPYSEGDKTEPILLDLKGGETLVKTIIVAK